MTKHLISFFFAILLIGLASCLNEKEDLSNNPHPSAVSIQTNTLAPNIESTVFTIDETNLTISNSDSIAYNSRIDKLVPVFSFAEGVEQILINGTIWNTTDSIDFSSPVIIQFKAKDKLTTAEYTFKVNKHTVDPEAITWTKRADNFTNLTNIEEMAGLWFQSQAILFVQKGNETFVLKSNNGQTWTEATSSNIPLEVSTILVHKNAILAISKNHHLITSVDGINWSIISSSDEISFINILCSLQNKAWIVGDKNNITYIYSYNSESETITEVTTVSDKLPYIEVSKAMMKTKNGIEKSVLISGKNNNDTPVYSVFSSMTGDYWVNVITETASLTFGERIHATAIWLDSKLLLFGGSTANNNNLLDVYISSDEGYTWEIASSNKQLPVEIGARKKMIGFVDSNNTLWLIGGIDALGNIQSDVWQGRLNKFDFIKQD